MSIFAAKRLTFLLSFTSFALVGSTLPAQAEAEFRWLDSPEDSSLRLESANLSDFSPQEEIATPEKAPSPESLNASKSLEINSAAVQKESSPATPDAETIPQLFPTEEVSQIPQDSVLAQRDIELGRLTRTRLNYIGVGGNIGLTGETGVGESTFVINSKIAVSPDVSIRPAIHLGNNTAFLIPITYDFYLPPRDDFEPVRIFPFVGGGVAITTDNEDDNDESSNVGFLLTGGLDYPITDNFTANATLNIGFIDETEVGIVLGIGYIFGGF